jgi:hypothetical protein
MWSSLCTLAGANLNDCRQDADALVQIVEDELTQLGLLASLDLCLLLAPDLLDRLLREVLAHELVSHLLHRRPVTRHSWAPRSLLDAVARLC